MEGAVIQERTHLRFLASLADDVELLLSAIVLAGKAEQLEEEGATTNVGRVVAELGTQRVDRFVELAGLQKIAWCHDGTRKQERAWNASDFISTCRERRERARRASDIK